MTIPHCPDHQKRRSFWRIGILLLLVISIILGRIYRQPLLQLISGQLPTTHLSLPSCDLNEQTCGLPISTPATPEALWLFSITPHPIPVSTLLTFRLTPPEQILVTNEPATVWVDILGDSMDMGVIRIPLTRTPDGYWEGTGHIPLCITGKMRWRARLNLQLAKTVLQADWLFEAPLEPHSVGHPQ